MMEDEMRGIARLSFQPGSLVSSCLKLFGWQLVSGALATALALIVPIAANAHA
jgi:hypothetical protein